MMERGHDRDTLQCRIKVKELQSAYCKAHDANGRLDAPPTTCRFYKELDAILGVNPTSTPSTTIDTSEPVWGRGKEEEEENGSDGGGPDGDTPESLEPCSQELFSSQEEGSQSQRPVLGGGQTEEQVPTASTLRPQPSLLSPAQRLQRLRKRQRKSKDDMLQEVMRQSIKENEKAQNWRERESRIRQENAAHRQQSTVQRQQSIDRLISILGHQADAIQELVAMQKEEQYRKRHSPCPKTLSIVPHCHLQPTFPNFRVLHTTRCLQHQYLHHPSLKTPTLTLCTQPPSPCSIAILKCSTHCTAHQTGHTRICDCTVHHSTPLFLFNKWL
ncbi:uncharacterized protein LOC128837171 isoform X1 [Malaclemys terrapin pileata]|uniref:uncharacterized protein LOC128837171 isoform X1 n=1 Tax=Malaclemys terrapin pileata TaxID=2991368 RepID=UPI0023A8C0AC|nr:uncharacterized protein LOC128837171 isoform X1 [Malaclemys terrapin pileata]